jgi:hypothetical protein
VTSIDEVGTGACRALTGEPLLAIGVPSYYYPGPAWEETVAAAAAVRYMVVNPADGPGQAFDPAYRTAIAQAEAAGIRLLGYVSTTWGTRPVDEVLQDVQRYRDWYGVSAIFLDEACSAKERLPHYRDLSAAIRAGAQDGLVALNPGVTPDEGYACVADLLLQFEGPWSGYMGWSPPAWQADYPRDRFWHVVYDTPARRLAPALAHATTCRAGVVYVTDRRLHNPWDGLPSYWSAEVAAVAEAHGRAGRRPPGASEAG